MGFLVGVAGFRYYGPGFLVAMTGVYGGVGAGVGAGIDAMVTTNQILYDSSWQKARAKGISLKLASW